MALTRRKKIKRLADELELPIISTSYDSFTVATMINRAIYDQLIKKDILLVEDIFVPMEDTANAQKVVKPLQTSNRLNVHTSDRRLPSCGEK